MPKISLADRFQALQEDQKKEEFMALSYEQLSQMRIAFGETKVNQTFLEVIEGDPKYVQWFARKYQDSKKEAHQAFLHFLDIYLERKEMERGLEQTVESPRRLHLQPKSKSRPAPRLPAEDGSPNSWIAETMPWEGPMDEHLVPLPVQEELDENRRRITNMENALVQISQQLQVLTQAATSQGKI